LQVDSLSRTSLGCGLVFEIIKAATNVTDLATNTETILIKLAELVKETEHNILEDYYGSRLYKKLVNSDSESSVKNGFASILYERLQGNLASFALKKGSSFVVCSLLESSATKELVIKELKPAVTKLKSSEEAGAKIIVQILESYINTSNSKKVKRKVTK